MTIAETTATKLHTDSACYGMKKGFLTVMWGVDIVASFEVATSVVRQCKYLPEYSGDWMRDALAIFCEVNGYTLYTK